MAKTKFIRCDETTHQKLKIHTARENRKTINETIKHLLEVTKNDKD